MIKPARPTRRCLSLLEEDWESAADKNAVRHATGEGGLDALTKELHLLDHQLVRKASNDFDVENSTDLTLKREGITDLREPMWWKVKVGRWRGAIYQDANGQAWLCAGGYRRGKESTDFYQRFMAEVNAHGPGQFLPTDEDRARLKDEVDEARFVEWEGTLQEDAREWTAEARNEGLVSRDVLDPDGDVIAEVTIAYSEEAFDGDQVADLYIEFVCKDWDQYDLLTWAETVMCLAIDPREQTWRPTNVASGRSYSMVLETAECDELMDAMNDSSLSPGEAVMGHEAHYAHRHRLTESTVMGEAVKGLCGRWFVPRQDHADKPPCKECHAVYSKIPSD